MAAEPDGDSYADPQASGVLLAPDHADIGARVRPVRQDPGTGLLGDTDEGPGCWIVGVDDRKLRPGRCRRLLDWVARADREPLEQRQLRIPVRLPRAVELEVFVGQVREDRGVIGDGPNPMRREAVGCRLDDRSRISREDHGPQCSLQVRRSGRRHVFRVRLAQRADLQIDRPDETRRDTGGLECRDGEERCRRLAVGPRDTDNSEFAARVAVPPGRSVGERGPRAFDDELWDARSRRPRARREPLQPPPRRLGRGDRDRRRGHRRSQRRGCRG